MFLRNVSMRLQEYIVSQHRKSQSDHFPKGLELKT
jgi:hypothetical protein